MRLTIFHVLTQILRKLDIKYKIELLYKDDCSLTEGVSASLPKFDHRTNKMFIFFAPSSTGKYRLYIQLPEPSRTPYKTIWTKIVCTYNLLFSITLHDRPSMIHDHPHQNPSKDYMTQMFILSPLLCFLYLQCNLQSVVELEEQGLLPTGLPHLVFNKTPKFKLAYLKPIKAKCVGIFIFILWQFIC